MIDCSEKFDWVLAADLSRDLQALSGGFLVGGLLGEYEVIELMAIAREFNTKIEQFSELITNFTGKAVLCDLIERFGIEDKLQVVQEYFNELDAKLQEAEDAIQNAAEAAASPSLEAIETAISGVYEEYDSEIEIIRNQIKDSMRDALSVLTVLGASQAEIDTAIENAELSTDIEAFTNDIFTSLMNDAFDKIEDNF